jgi:hypothetical protein
MVTQLKDGVFHYFPCNYGHDDPGKFPVIRDILKMDSAEIFLSPVYGQFSRERFSRIFRRICSGIINSISYRHLDTFTGSLPGFPLVHDRETLTGISPIVQSWLSSGPDMESGFPSPGIRNLG